MITETMLNCFLTLRRTLNFTKTAEELYMTQQSVSQNISKLEADLGLKLFVRDTHSVRLTECGVLYGEQLARLIRQHKSLVSDLRLNCANGGVFRVGISDHPDFSFLFSLIQANAATLLPGFLVELHPLPPNEMMSQLLKQNLDLAYLLDRYIPKREGLLTQVVLRLNMAIYVSRKHPAYTPNAGIEAFTHDPLIIKGKMHDGRFYGSNEYVCQEADRAGLCPSAFILVNDEESSLSAVGAGRGVMLCTMANQRAAEYNLAAIPIPGYEAVFTGVWCDYVSGTLHSDLCTRVAQLCAQVFPEK